jgi:Fe2+-dicitrate sensor, membrane component
LADHVEKTHLIYDQGGRNRSAMKANWYTYQLYWMPDTFKRTKIILMTFNEDEFLILLLRQLDNCTNWDEDRYIDYMLRRYDRARQLKQDVTETFPQQAERHPNFMPAAWPLSLVKRYEPVMETADAVTLQSSANRRHLNIAAAVLVAAVVILSLFLIPSIRSDHRHLPGSSKGVILEMAKGERVELGAEVATIPTRYALLSTNAEMLQFSAQPGKLAFKENTLRVPAAHSYNVTLEDGTIVHMNAATELRFAFTFSSISREVYVDGEAYFSVAKDEKRPFIVHTKKGNVRVLGTDFNINTYEDNFIVSLVSGAVIVDPKKGPSMRLQPCQEMVLDPVSLEASLIDFRGEMVMGWLKGQYRFIDQPLSEVCKVVERLYGIRIRFDRERLGNVKFTGKVDKNETVEGFFEKMKENTEVGMWYYDEEGTIHLDRNEENEGKKDKKEKKEKH